MPALLDANEVALFRGKATYPRNPPYPPGELYPERAAREVGAERNPAYEGVRLLLLRLGCDAQHFGTPGWNPLAAALRPGQTVVVKPNLVLDHNLGRHLYGETDTDSLVTHGAVIRAVLDYVALGLRGDGAILLADCPVQGANWERLLELIGWDEVRSEVRSRFPGVDLEAADFRLGRAEVSRGTVVRRVPVDAPPADYREIDLGTDSLLAPLEGPGARFGVTQYPFHRMERAHGPGRHKYLFPARLLEASAFFNIGKMKTHMKAGITGVLKNLVGTVGHKDYLPHFRMGSPDAGGDEYPNGNWFWNLLWQISHREWRLEGGGAKRILSFVTQACGVLLPPLAGLPRHSAFTLGGGSWSGNDTLWRTVLDINRAFLYCDPSSGILGPEPSASRAYFCFLDGLVGGECEGPLAPRPVPSGMMLAARNPAALDAAAAALMGFDVHRIPTIREAFGDYRWPLTRFTADQVVVDDGEERVGLAEIQRRGPPVPFRPSHGFKGRIEQQLASRA